MIIPALRIVNADGCHLGQKDDSVIDAKKNLKQRLSV